MQTQNPSPHEPVNFDGRIGELYKIFLLNLFLGILTLGIYHFWGKTRVRRYVTSSFSIANDRLEYTGYGSELFWGFIKALIILVVLAIPLFWYAHTHTTEIDKVFHKIEESSKEKTEDEQKDKQAQIKAGSTLITPTDQAQQSTPSVQNKQEKGTKITASEALGLNSLTPEEKRIFYTFITLSVVYWLFFVVYLRFVAIFSSVKYRVTRTHWRGIRGHMEGSSILYGLVGVFHLLLKILTLGLWIPFGDALVWKYKMKRLSFGNQPATYTPSYGQLFLSHIGTLLFSALIALLVVALYLFCITFFVLEPKDLPNISAVSGGFLAKLSIYIDFYQKYLTGAILAGFYSFIIIGFISRFWYRASFTRMKYNALRFGDVRFHCTITGWRLFRQQMGNFFILLLTLGLGYPIVKIRRQRFFSRYFRIYGDLQNLNVQQATGEKDKWGEGLGSMFDLEVGLF